MKIKVPDYTASPRQTLFHQANCDEVLYGGAAGGGKSAAIVAEGITLALEYPGIPIDFFRRTIPELKGTILPEIYKQAGSYINAGFMTWHGQDRQFRLSNGSLLNLNYLDTDADIYRYQGREMPIILVDELTQFPQAWIEYLKTRNRTSNPNYPVKFMAGSNPGGVGHGWVKTRFIDVAPPETPYTDNETGETRIYIPAKVDDHPLEAFRKSYTKKLNAITDPDLKRALRDGDWDVFAGQVFTEWSRNKHVVEPFHIPEHWSKWRSMDYGNHNATLWFAKDPASERIYVYREHYTTSFQPVSQTAQEIRQLEAGENVSFGLADPAIWKGAGDHNTGDAVAQMFEKEKVYWQPANNDRIAGKTLVHEMLSVAKDGLPKMQVFSNCLNLIRTLPSLPYDKNRVEDVDTKAEDHLYDALRYGLMSQVPAKTARVYVPPSILRKKRANRA